MTPEEFAALKKSNEDLSAQIKTVVESVKPLTDKVAVLEKENGELKGKVNLTSQEVQFNGLKTKYPDVPESVLKALPEAEREAHLTGRA